MGVRAHPASTLGGESLSEFAQANSLAAPSRAAQVTSPVGRIEEPSAGPLLDRHDRMASQPLFSFDRSPPVTRWTQTPVFESCTPD